MDVTDRTLALLALLAGRASWTGPELSDRLGVTIRTVRRDVARLRRIGYRIDSVTGTEGGYRLAAGTRLPPLVFDDDEAVALAALLAQASGSPIEGVGEAAGRALAKVGQVLPRRLRDRVAAISEVEFGASPNPDHPRARIDGATLARLAGAARDGEVVGFGYSDRAGRSTRRRVEPHRVVTGFGWWYLIGYDLDRGDWRTFRLDRISDPEPTGRRVPQRRLPADGALDYLHRVLADAPYPYRVAIMIEATEAQVRARVGYLLPSRIRPLPDGGHRVEFGSAELADVVAVALAVVALGAPYRIEGTAEVLDALRGVAVGLTGRIGTGA